MLYSYHYHFTMLLNKYSTLKGIKSCRLTLKPHIN